VRIGAAMGCDNRAARKSPGALTYGACFSIAARNLPRMTDRRLLAKSGVAPNLRQSRPRRTAPGVV
jgi:hypothetical protein